MAVILDLDALFASHSGEVLPKYARLYFDLLWSDLLSVLPTCAGDPNEPVITALVKNRESGPTWGSLHTLENLILNCQSPEQISRLAWLIRARYKHIAGPEDYAAYLLSKPPSSRTDNEADSKLLKADIRILMREILWLYAITPVRERARRKLGLPMLILTVVLVVLVVTAYFLFRWWCPSNPREMPLLIVVLALGALGGFISAQRRLFRAPGGGDRIIQVIQLEPTTLEYIIPPISGRFLRS